MLTVILSLQKWKGFSVFCWPSWQKNHLFLSHSSAFFKLNICCRREKGIIFLSETFNRPEHWNSSRPFYSDHSGFYKVKVCAFCFKVSDSCQEPFFKRWDFFFCMFPIVAVFPSFLGCFNSCFFSCVFHFLAPHFNLLQDNKRVESINKFRRK